MAEREPRGQAQVEGTPGLGNGRVSAVDVIGGCRWCGEPVTTTRVVVPADINARTKEVRAAAIEANVCDKHAAMIDRNVREAELEKTIHRLGVRLGRTMDHTTTHARLVKELGEARLELAELRTP
jgi:hypothetical protein